MTTVTHATAVTGTDNPAYQVSKDEWNGAGSHTVVDDLKLATLDLSSAQIKALNTTPITVVAAPGAGLFVTVVSATMQLKFVTTAYSSGGPMRLWYGALASAGAVSFSTHYTRTVDTLVASTPLSSGTPPDVSNQALVVRAEDSDPTLGDGTVRITVRYTIEAWA